MHRRYQNAQILTLKLYIRKKKIKKKKIKGGKSKSESV